MFLWAAHVDCGDNLLYGFAPYFCLHTIAECVSYALAICNWVNIFMNQFQFRHYWQTTPCFYLLALKSCLMPQSLSNRYYKEFQRWFWSVVLHFKPRTTAFEYKSEEQGKEEGWDWVVWLGSMMWCWFLVCVAVAVEWSWRISQENEWMNIRDVLGALFNSLCPVDLIQCVLQNELVFILGIVTVSIW